MRACARPKRWTMPFENLRRVRVGRAQAQPYLPIQPHASSMLDVRHRTNDHKNEETPLALIVRKNMDAQASSQCVP